MQLSAFDFELPPGRIAHHPARPRESYLRGDAIVASDNRAANEWPQVIRGVCGLPAASIKASGPQGYAAPIPAITQRITTAGRRPVLLAATQDGVNAIAQLGRTPQLIVSIGTTEDQHLLTRRPDGEDALAIQFWLAR